MALITSGCVPLQHWTPIEAALDWSSDSKAELKVTGFGRELQVTNHRWPTSSAMPMENADAPAG